MNRTVSRYDVNRKIKFCLVSHKVNLTELNFSFSGKTAWFHGKLIKFQGTEFSTEEIEILCKDIFSLPAIKFLNFELEDWCIISSMGSFSISRKVIAATTGAVAQKPLFINSEEDIEDVLTDKVS